MLKYYLDGQQVTGPLRLDGLTLRKDRNRKYWGFLHRKLGYVDGATNLRFDESDALATLEVAMNRAGVQAETTFRIEQNGAVLYDGFIDYATYVSDGEGISVGLRDDRAVLDLSSGATTIYGLAPTEQIGLHERKLGGLPSLVTDPGTLIIQRAETSARPITHSVPLTRRSETDDTIAGTLAPVVSPLSSSPCYHNTSPVRQSVTLRGLVSVTASASSTRTVTLRVVPSDDADSAVVVGSRPITTTPTLIQMAVDVTVSVAAGASLKLEWVGSSNVSRWTFTYDERTAIGLSDEKTFAASTAPCLSALDAFEQLTARLTAGRLAFRSDWLSAGEGYGLILLNGAGIRSVNRSLPVSLESLFVGLTAVFNLSLWVEGVTLRVEPKANQPKNRSQIDTVGSRTEAVATDFLYNSVRVGYATWQAEGATLSNDEPNGNRAYSTGITAIRSELNVVSELITASGLIETQRRKQFDPKTASENKADSLDDALFLISAVPGSGGWRAETGQRTEFIAGNYEPVTLYNQRLTPGRNLSRWANWLAPSLPLMTQAVQGSDSLITTVDGVTIREADPLSGPPARTPRLVMLTTPMSLPAYADLGDEVEYYYRNKTHSGELLDAEWRLTNEGETATLTLLER